MATFLGQRCCRYSGFSRRHGKRTRSSLSRTGACGVSPFHQKSWPLASRPRTRTHLASPAFRRPHGSSFLLGVRSSVAVRIAASVGNHVDVRVRAAVLGVARANLEYPRGAGSSVDQVVAIGIAALECRTVPRTQGFLARLRNQDQLTLEHPHELVLTGVPMALA